MLNRLSAITFALLGLTLLLGGQGFAQDAGRGGRGGAGGRGGNAANAQNTSNAVKDWPDPIANRNPAAGEKKPAPVHDIGGLWGSRLGNQAKGVQLHPNDGKPANEPPYTALGRELYKSHKALEGFDAVPPAENNDPRTRCEPLGFPRANHYDLGVRIYQSDVNVAMLYQYDNRWRIVWTDGRSLPKLLDGGVEINGEYREQRWMGYSVGKWLDDYTLQIETVGTMSEDRVWLDNTGRPISDQVKVTETIKRLDHDTLEWSETLEDPKIFTKPWQTMKLQMTLQDQRADVLTRYCSPMEVETYNQLYGDSASSK